MVRSSGARPAKRVKSAPPNKNIMPKIILNRRDKIRSRIRGKVSGNALRPRLSVFRSNRRIYAQIIDDGVGITLLSLNTAEVSKGVKKNQAHEVGLKLAQAALKKGIEKIVFDRGGYLYHGRVQALAEGLREGGLEF